ncbi:MAG: hypothetical protein ACYDD6_04805 [Acidimicrobiales bacterium]
MALTSLFASLVPVFAPLCFVPVAFDRRVRSSTATVTAIRVLVVTGLGWCVAAMHLLLWVVLADATGSIGPPGIGDVPFMALTVALTAVVSSAVLAAPRSDRWARPAATGTSVVLYVAAFVVHGTLLSPSLAEVRGHFSGGPAATEVVGGVVALVAVALLLRRELGAAEHEGGRGGAQVPG